MAETRYGNYIVKVKGDVKGDRLYGLKESRGKGFRLDHCFGSPSADSPWFFVPKSIFLMRSWLKYWLWATGC